MIRQIKQTTLRALKGSGVFELTRRSSWRQRQLLILSYHGISLDDEHEWNPDVYMKASDFEARLQMLAEGGFSVLSLDEGLRRLYTQDLPPASVAITVDDGHHDFLEQAYPRLKLYGFPVTVYLSSFYTMTNLPIFDGFCSYLLWKGRGSVMAECAEIGIHRPFDLSEQTGRRDAWRAIEDFVKRKHLKATEKDRVLRLLAKHLGVSYEDLAVKRILHNLSPSDVSRLAKEGVSFQLHTHRHRTPLDRSLFDREIADNRACITEITGEEPVHFCYPSGVHRPDFLPWLTAQQIVSATTCDRGINSPKANPLLLARLLDHSGLRPIEFEAWLSGCGAWLPRRASATRGTD